MFTLDAELRSERWNPKDQKSKSEIKKELEDSIANSNKNKQSKNGTQSKEDATKVIHEFEEKSDLLPGKSCECYLMNVSVS